MHPDVSSLRNKGALPFTAAALLSGQTLVRTMLSNLRTLATGLRPGFAAWWRRLALCVVAACVGVQGVALSAERVLGGRHFHVASVHAVARHVSDLDGHRYAPEVFDLASDPALDHADLQQHGHDANLPGVMHVADDGGVSSQNSHATLVRSVHDLALLIPAFELPPAGEAAGGWAATRSRGFESHVSPPLERPPQV